MKTIAFLFIALTTATTTLADSAALESNFKGYACTVTQATTPNTFTKVLSYKFVEKTAEPSDLFENLHQTLPLRIYVQHTSSGVLLTIADGPSSERVEAGAKYYTDVSLTDFKRGLSATCLAKFSN